MNNPLRLEAELATRALSEREDVWPAAERVRYWETLGTNDRRGEQTTEIEGDAAPEPDSVAKVPLTDPMDRLVWLLRHTEVVCLDGQTSRIIVPPSGGFEALIAVLRAAETAGLAERWSDQGPPKQLDVSDRYRAVGIRLTKRGKEEAARLEQEVGAHLPLEALPH